MTLSDKKSTTNRQHWKLKACICARTGTEGQVCMEIYYMPCFGMGYGFDGGRPRSREVVRLTGGGIDSRFRSSSRPIRAHSWHIWWDKPGKAVATVRNH